MPLGTEAYPRLSRRAFVGGALVAAASLALAGCGKQEEVVARVADADADEPQLEEAPVAPAIAATPVSGGTFKFGVVEVASIDPCSVQADQGMQVVACLFDPLTTYDAKTGQLLGKACTSWEAAEDATRFTFHLREGASFHNGEPVTSSSFAYAWNRLCAIAAASDALEGLSSVAGFDEVVAAEQGAALDLDCSDEYTLVVNLASPDANFPYAVSHLATSPVPQSAASDDEAFFLAPVGNGAFALKAAWTPGETLQVVRNDSYVGEKPYVNGVDFVPYDSDEDAFTAFKAGALDVAPVPLAELENAVAQYGAAPDGRTANPAQQVVTGAGEGSDDVAGDAAPFALVASDRVNELCVDGRGIADLASCWLSA